MIIKNFMQYINYVVVIHIVIGGATLLPSVLIDTPCPHRPQLIVSQALESIRSNCGPKSFRLSIIVRMNIEKKRDCVH